MGRPTGLEPSCQSEAKSLEIADLVEIQFLENGDKKQVDESEGSQKPICWQPDSLKAKSAKYLNSLGSILPSDLITKGERR
jgi:hypothetical protein